MSKEKESGVIQIFVPDLPDTPGWAKLTRKKQDALLEHTSHIQQNRQLQMLGEFGELMELYQVQQLLEGEEMKMSDYIRRIYPERTQRTIDRKREAFATFVASVPAAVLNRVAALGVDALSRFDRIANAYLGDIKNAVKELPALTSSTDKDVEKYLEELDSKLLENRRSRPKGKSQRMDEDLAAKMAANTLRLSDGICRSTQFLDLSRLPR